MKKILALILAATMMTAMLVSCKKAEVGDEPVVDVEIDETMAPETVNPPAEETPQPEQIESPETPTEEPPFHGSRPMIPAELPGEKPVETPEQPVQTPEVPETPAKPEPPAEPEAPAAPAGVSMELTTIIDEIYKINDPILPAMSIPVDLTDEYSLSSFTGLADASLIKEAVASESMMGAQAYSLVLVRLQDASKAAEVAQAMRNGIDQRKWICVMADDIRVVAAGDVVMLCMIASDLDVKVNDMVDAFSTVVGLPFTTDIR